MFIPAHRELKYIDKKIIKGVVEKKVGPITDENQLGGKLI